MNERPRRLLHLTSLPSGDYREAFRARQLVEAFIDAGWEVLVRHSFTEDRAESINANPALKDLVSDATEYEDFGPDVVLSEEGLLSPGTDEWAAP